VQQSRLHLHHRGQYAEAEPLYQQALTILVESLGPQHPNTKTVSGNYLSCLVEMGREAEERAPGFVAQYKVWKEQDFERPMTKEAGEPILESETSPAQREEGE
jgi:hypothetical protein